MKPKALKESCLETVTNCSFILWLLSREVVVGDGVLIAFVVNEHTHMLTTFNLCLEK